MKQFRIVLGIEVGKDFLRIAEVEHREGSYFLSRIAEKKFKSLETDDLVVALSQIINDESIMSRVASIAIDSTLMARDTIETDPELGPDEISRFIRAEIDFHNNFSGAAFIPAYETTKTQVDPYKEIFYAAMEKKLLITLRDTCTRCGLELQFMDIDHSCSEHAVNKLERDVKNWMLATVKEGQVEASFCREGERLIYRHLLYSGEPFYFITKLTRELEMKAKEDADKIFITGSLADNFLIDLLRKSVDERYELLNPVSGLQLSGVVSENNDIAASPHHYSHAIGAALK